MSNEGTNERPKTHYFDKNISKVNTTRCRDFQFIVLGAGLLTGYVNLALEVQRVCNHVHCIFDRDFILLRNWKGFNSRQTINIEVMEDLQVLQGQPDLSG